MVKTAFLWKRATRCLPLVLNALTEHSGEDLPKNLRQPQAAGGSLLFFLPALHHAVVVQHNGPEKIFTSSQKPKCWA